MYENNICDKCDKYKLQALKFSNSCAITRAI